VLIALDSEFTKIYADSGRPSIPPERLLRALLLQAFYTIRSETQLMEQLHYNLLYRWFVGLGADEPVWGADGGRNGERDFHGETRSNDTHASRTDPQARLYRKGKGKEAKLSYIGTALTENRHGLVVEAELGSATGTIEREAAVRMVARHSPGSRRLTLGADKAYDVHGFVDDLRDLNVTPHIAQNTTNRTSAIDARTTSHPGYAISQQKAQANRRTIRLGQDDRWARAADAARRRALTVQVHPDYGSLRPHPAAQIAWGGRMTGRTINEISADTTPQLG